MAVSTAGLSRCRSMLLASALACALVSLPGAALAQQVEITVSVSPDSGSVADRYVAQVHISVPGERGPDRYWPPEFEGFTVAHQQSHTTTMQSFEPGLGLVTTTEEEHNYVLQPERAGALRIHGARVRVAGRDHEAAPVVIDVQDRAAPVVRDPTRISGVGAPGFEPPGDVARAGGRAADMFMHVAVHPKEAYVGEQITVTWLLYTRHELLKLEPSVPRLDDFWTEILYEPSAYYRYDEDVVGGVSYRVLVVSKRALFATRPGRLEIGPFQVRASSLYTPLGDTIDMASAAVEIAARALPAGAPPGFDSSYVGTFEVAAEVDRQELDAGESLTLTVNVTGQGAIRRTTPPVVQVPGFEFRAPRDYDETMQPSTATVSGKRTYRYWATPQRGGRQVIPAIAVDYFNPRTGAYEQARSQPIPIAVTGDPAALASAIRRHDASADELRPIKDGAVSSRIAPRLYASPWFWMASALPLLAFAAVMLVTRGRGRGAAGQGRAARKRFEAAERLMRDDAASGRGRPAVFFAELARILFACIEERVAEPVQSMTRDELEAYLAARGLAPGLLVRVRRALEQCDFARFAGTEVTAAEMQAALERMRALVADLAAARLDERGHKGAEVHS